MYKKWCVSEMPALGSPVSKDEKENRCPDMEPRPVFSYQPSPN